MKPTAGDLLNDKIELLRPLGAGGMGSVWVARHLALDSDVAVKFINRDVGGRQLVRFKREASLAAKLKSPHVVRTFDFGARDDGTPYIVMELLSGESLAERLERVGRLTPHDAAPIVSQISLALTEAHELDIVHRDIKPANIFLVDSGYELFVKLLDFGVAKQSRLDVAKITHTGAVIGTPLYMSPEQLMSTKDVDHRTDLWALAVVAYHMLTGQTPFAGKTMPALSLSVSQGRFTPASALSPDIGPEIDAWFKLALCRNINGRFKSARELSRTFAEACDCAALSLRTSRPSQPSRSSVPTHDGARSEDSAEPADGMAITEASDGSGDETVSASRDPIAAPATKAPAAEAAAPLRRRARWWPVVLAVGLGAIVLARNWGFWRAAPAVAQPSAAAVSASPPPPVNASVSAPTITTVEPTPSSSASVAPPAAPPRPIPTAASAPPKPDCSTPFTIDDNGVYHPRPECLR